MSSIVCSCQNCKTTCGWNGRNIIQLERAFANLLKYGPSFKELKKQLIPAIQLGSCKHWSGNYRTLKYAAHNSPNKP